VLDANHSSYDDARKIWNGMVDRRPALIARCLTEADVSAAVRFACAHRMLVSVRGGGHHIAGNAVAEGGLMIDLSGMRKVEIDAGSRTARVGPGALLGDFDRAGQAHGLATPLGINSTTGVAGLTLGGGFGWLTRRYGMTVDNLLGATIVTADGEVRVASARSEPELFWALRGGGGNFGVVTSFEFRLHPARREVIGGSIVFPIERARELLGRYAEYSVQSADELYLDCWIAYPRGKTPLCGFDVCYSGPAGDADRVLAPLRRVGTPLADRIKAIDYVALQRSTDATDPRAEGNYARSGFTTGITAATIAAILAGLRAEAQWSSTVYFQHLGGAIGRVDPAATAFAYRYARQNMMVFADWKAGEDSAAPIRWARDFWTTLEPFTRGFYINEIDDDEGASRLNANYLGNYPRLAAIKRQYDPTNLFRLNANITPAA